ncbi:MAG: hypothetical protein BGO05_26925 [Rhizobiales bacterium 63-7]|uniref:hypothetical protein n=1 Tax=Rhizobium sp. YJ-22 TaxID=3037556 RepID=UPI00092BF3B2|nr:hypothetical protein [Rhizobium sp. YJ-22]MBN9028304.1 hypothetical protein [Hyphomicrobiales bacterium]MDG3577198.1 hypothetical protein [Rhizobium sp. YJ-22]OJU67165.1 MAG: hypothetical protein BGO05_26925 [Rhizobiales bacterium 63-7]
MSFNIDPSAFEQETLRQIWPIRDFCMQYNLDLDNERRLRTLFGEYATAVELLMNVERRPRFR